MISASFTVFAAGLICFAAFSWALKSHFRHTGHVPFGAYGISVLSVIGFLWFAWRILAGRTSSFWEVAVILFILSILLFAWTINASRKTRPTLVFDTDEPIFLLDHGPYQYVRHPFYASYLVFWIGTATASPGLLPWLAPVVMLLVYWNAARREERKFAGSALASAYQSYQAKAGMFTPRRRTKLNSD
jgi:protein-S-isoprenylcysteine O-methyltransferase Ste14